MGDICKLFEREGEGAADKESTFERIMDLMQKVMQHYLLSHKKAVYVQSETGNLSCFFYQQLQDLGQPPKELAGDAVSKNTIVCLTSLRFQGKKMCCHLIVPFITELRLMF